MKSKGYPRNHLIGAFLAVILLTSAGATAAETTVPPKTGQTQANKYQVAIGKETKNLKAKAPVLVTGISPASFGFTTLSQQVEMVLQMSKQPSWRRRWTCEAEIWLKYRGEQLRGIDHLTVEHVQRDGDQIRVLCRRTISTEKERSAAPYLPVAVVGLGKLPAGKYQVQWVVQTYHPDDKEHPDGSADKRSASEKPKTLQHSFTVEPATEKTSAAGAPLDRICKVFPASKHIPPDRFSSHPDLPALVRIAETDIDLLLAEGSFRESYCVINPQTFKQFRETTRMSPRLPKDRSKANDAPTLADYEEYMATWRELEGRRCRLDRRREIIWMIVKKVASTRRQVLVDLLNHKDVSIRWSTTQFLLTDPSLKEEKVVAALQAIARDKPRPALPGESMSLEQSRQRELPDLAARVLTNWKVMDVLQRLLSDLVKQKPVGWELLHETGNVTPAHLSAGRGTYVRLRRKTPEPGVGYKLRGIHLWLMDPDYRPELPRHEPNNGSVAYVRQSGSASQWGKWNGGPVFIQAGGETEKEWPDWARDLRRALKVGSDANGRNQSEATGDMPRAGQQSTIIGLVDQRFAAISRSIKADFDNVVSLKSTSVRINGDDSLRIAYRFNKRPATLILHRTEEDTYKGTMRIPVLIEQWRDPKIPADVDEGQERRVEEKTFEIAVRVIARNTINTDRQSSGVASLVVPLPAPAAQSGVAGAVPTEAAEMPVEQSREAYFPQSRAIAPDAIPRAEVELINRLEGGSPNMQIGTKALIQEAGLPRVVTVRRSAPPDPYLVTDGSGRYYARCAPGTVNPPGTTTIYRVDLGGDKVIDRYLWFERFHYPGRLYVQSVGFDPKRGTPIIALLRMHNSRNAESRDEQVELSIYLAGKLVQHVTTKQLDDLGAEVKAYQGGRIADGDYAVYRFNGYDASKRQEHPYGCFSFMIGGNIVLIDIAKGDIVVHPTTGSLGY